MLTRSPRLIFEAKFQHLGYCAKRWFNVFWAQNHRIVEAGSDFWGSSGPTSPAQDNMWATCSSAQSLSKVRKVLPV